MDMIHMDIQSHLWNIFLNRISLFLFLFVMHAASPRNIFHFKTYTAHAAGAISHLRIQFDKFACI